MSALDRIRAERGLISRIARELGITRGAVAQWDRIPAERVPEVSRITGLPKHELRPDLFDPPATAPQPQPAAANDPAEAA